MLITFDDTSFTVEVPDRPDFLEALRGAAGNWMFSPGSGKPLATVHARGKKYRLVSAGGECADATAVGAACGAVAEVIEGYVAENPSRLCLHCGSVEFGGRLVVFPSAYRAGKSTLVTRLAMAGYRIFGDDVLPLSDDDSSGVAPGLAPRLRLPLPETASQTFREFVCAQTGPGDGYYQYLTLPVELHARRGEELPLGAVVLLDRQPTGSASLLIASRSRALQALITRNFARAAPAAELLDRLHVLMARLPILTLRYSDLDEAAVLLAGTFADWPARLDDLEHAGQEAPGAGSSDAVVPPAHFAGVRFRQNQDVTLRKVDGELFLADSTGTSIHHLNRVGAGLWSLLIEPLTEEEAIRIVCGAFPDADRGAVARDVRRLIAALLAGELILAEGGKR